VTCAGTGRETIRCRVIYAGRVQGVFFRATAREIAQRHGVAGYARNQHDGTVELEAEGPPDKIDAFLAASPASTRATSPAPTEPPIPARATRSHLRFATSATQSFLTPWCPLAHPVGLAVARLRCFG